MGIALKNCSVQELHQMVSDGVECQIIDVRENNEYESIRIKDTTLVPLSEFVGSISKIDKSKTAYMLCGIGKRAAKAGEYLLENGYSDVVVIDGGIKAWYEAGYPVEN